MAAPIPQKIVFISNTMASGSQEPSSSAQDEPSTSTQPRLIPPSEIQELGQLPSNMFVTSVNVESEMWNEHLSSPQKKGKTKKKPLNGERYSNTTDWHDSSQVEEEGGITSENGQFDDADDGLPYFDTDVQTTTQPSAGTTSRPFDWDQAERLWKECAVLEKLEQLVVGCLVGWKVCNPTFFQLIINVLNSKHLNEQALAINPQTFSPEMLLIVARVINIGQGSALMTSEHTQSIVIRYLQRPGAGRAALAFGLNGAAGFNDQEQVEEDEMFEWTDILTRQWRVMKQ